MKVIFKTDEYCISFDMGNVKALDMYRFFHPRGLDAISRTNIYVLERRRGIFLYESLGCVDNLNKTQLPHLF